MRWIAKLNVALGLTLLGLLTLAACGGTADTNQRPTSQPPSLWRTEAAPQAETHFAPAASSTTVTRGTGSGPYPGPLLSEVPREPAVRVRVQTNITSLHIDSEQSLRASGPRSSGAKVYRYATPVSVTRAHGAWVMKDARGQRVSWRLPALLLECDNGAALKIGDKRYPRRLVLTPRTDDAGQETGAFDVVNHVPLETYLPGVIERELYAGWPLETFKTQAVAARSYALWEMTIAASRHYDLESTTASQVYGGQASNRTALRAVRETRGQVLAYDRRVLPAFFSSSTGGLGQDATAAFPRRVYDLPPLRARQHGAWDKESPRYRWGPIVRRSTTLAKRLAAWGKRQSHPVQNLVELRRIEISARNRVGRPTVFRVTDTRGQTFDLNCEHFRNACNFTRDGEIPLDSKQKLLSSHVDVIVAGGSTQFTNGRGHGHGVGLSQWGAQAMAKAGHAYPAILKFYYPGASVVALYR